MLQEDVPTAVALAMILETAVRIGTIENLAPPHPHTNTFLLRQPLLP